MIVSVLGLIGSGKSTLVNKLANTNNYSVFEEPVDNNPFLSDYYEDPNRWSFTLQIYYLWERYKQSQEAFIKSMRNETVILDSSLYSDFAFAMLQHNRGYFTDSEYSTYLNMHKIITAQTAYPDITVWLQLNPEQTLERIKKRSRDCESSISLKYLKSLDSTYQIVLEKLSKHTNIISIDATQSADKVYETANRIINDYRDSLKSDELDYV